jgi:hypothetical protein
VAALPDVIFDDSSISASVSVILHVMLCTLISAMAGALAAPFSVVVMRIVGIAAAMLHFSVGFLPDVVFRWFPSLMHFGPVYVMQETCYALSASCLPSSSRYRKVKMLLDSGASKVMHSDKSVFHNYVAISGVIQTAKSGSTIQVLGKGDILMQMTDKSGKLHAMWARGVWHVPEVQTTLFSVSAFRKVKGNKVIFDEGDYLESSNIQFPLSAETNEMYSITVRMMLPPRADGGKLMATMAPGHQDPSCISKSSSAASLGVWHQRFSHLSYDYIKRAKSLVRNLYVSDATEPPGPCATCVETNMRRTARPANADKVVATEPLERVHIDGMEGFEELSIFGQYRGAYLFCDDHSRAVRCHGYKKKSEALRCFQEYVTHMRSKSRSVKVFVLNMKSDQAKELCW